jgi:dihydrofolate reductase
MRKLIYSIGVSLDGYIAGPDGRFDWATPDDEQHRFHNEQERELGAHLCGRRMYETLRGWDDVDERSAAEEHLLEFARIWRSIPKFVFSTTLDEVGPNATLIKGDAVEEVRRLKGEAGGPLAVGGAGLASTFVRAGLVDEYGLFVNPVVVGGGTPFFPPLDTELDLELLETRTFGSRVVYLRYARSFSG